jgi:hypothetical protein
MIVPEELRIGNIVLLENNRNFKILWFRTSNACIMEVGITYPSAIVELDRLKSIELTEDWLEKFGFVKGWLHTKGYSISCHFYDIWHLTIEGKEKYSSDKVYISDYFKVHELQNLIYNITKEELILK